MRLGNESTDPCVQSRFKTVEFSTLHHDPFTEIGNRSHIVHGFFRVTDHEITFDYPPAAGIDQTGYLQKCVIRNWFIDNISQPVCGSFGGECETGLARAAQFFKQDPQIKILFEGGERDG